ncbi:neuromedin-U isoform X2 [Electrophorus electricus]|uniref:neuromedin-U isoform X2 n=1 Tax=Electrophorus electricus TaxID=8005 RepID=UPI0015CFA2FC|nr:neuromedin-U isoform X2 [Electrophorus electricus]
MKTSQDGTCATTAFPSAMNPFSLATLTLAVLVISAVPLCRSAPVFLNPTTVDHDQLLNQIDNACMPHLSAERPLRTPDLLREFCGLMLEMLRKAQELSARETSKRPNSAAFSDDTSTVFHPLLQLMPQLHSRRRRKTDPLEAPQSPRAIQSRGYFIYRPRNGRRSSEYV